MYFDEKQQVFHGFFCFLAELLYLCNQFIEWEIYNDMSVTFDDTEKIFVSSGKVNQYMLRCIYRFAQPILRKMELVKALSSKISFDMDAFEQSFLNDVLENGRPRYTEPQKEEERQSILKMLDLFHQKDCSTIAKDVKKSLFRPYMMQFLKFASDTDKELRATIRHQNVLVKDDVTTSGSTLNEVLRTLCILNEDNKITIFSLHGRKDLMAEAM